MVNKNERREIIEAKNYEKKLELKTIKYTFPSEIQMVGQWKCENVCVYGISIT